MPSILANAVLIIDIKRSSCSNNIKVWFITAEVSEEERWSIDEATKKFRPQEGQDYWRIAFKEGVNIDEHILERNFGKKSPKEYYARHDLTFLAPSGHELRCKVSVSGVGVGFTFDGRL